MSISLRIRHPTGTSIISFPDSTSYSYSDLQQKILDTSSILPSNQELRIGFPPKLIPSNTSRETSLLQLGIKSGDSIIVAESTSPSPSPSPPPSIAPPPSQPQPRSLIEPRTQTRIERIEGQEVDFVQVDRGYLIQRVVPDDNSCQFNALALVFNQSHNPQSLRNVVAEVIKSDDDTWSEAILGQSRQSYIEAILKPSTWGGAIELSILSTHFQVQIFSLDVQSGRVDKFGEEFVSRVYLVYSGIHYDALTFSYTPPTPTSTTEYPPQNIEFDTTQFSSSSSTSDEILSAALRLIDILRKKHAFTDAATFTLKCEECGRAIVGEKEAREHAKVEGHTKFGEYDG